MTDRAVVSPRQDKIHGIPVAHVRLAPYLRIILSLESMPRHEGTPIGLVQIYAEIQTPGGLSIRRIGSARARAATGFAEALRTASAAAAAIDDGTPLDTAAAQARAAGAPWRRDAGAGARTVESVAVELDEAAADARGAAPPRLRSSHAATSRYAEDVGATGRAPGQPPASFTATTRPREAS